MTYGWIDNMLKATLHHAAKLQSMHGDSSLEAHGALSLAQKADTDGILEEYWEQARDYSEPLPSARDMLNEI